MLKQNCIHQAISMMIFLKRSLMRVKKEKRSSLLFSTELAFGASLSVKRTAFRQALAASSRSLTSNVRGY